MKHFGTDGIRKKAGEFTTEFLAKIIKGLSDYAGTDIKILLGGDTRESSEWIMSATLRNCSALARELPPNFTTLTMYIIPCLYIVVLLDLPISLYDDL